MSVSGTARALLCLTVLASVTACTHDVDGDTAAVDVVDIVDEASAAAAAVTYVEPVEVDATRLYYGVHNEARLTDEAPLFHGNFDLLPNGKVDISVRRLEDRRRVVGFKIYRVNPTGTLRLLGVVESRRGVAEVRLRSDAGGSFVIAATSSGSGLLGIDIVCARRDGQCAPLGQPGATCGGRGITQCDDGLFCEIDAAQICGRADGTGVCAIPSAACPAVACTTVCGCDGVDYCDTCNAHAVGANVLHDGACEAPPDEEGGEDGVCDPAVYTKLPDGQFANTHGTWVHKSTYAPPDRMEHDLVATLHLNDGDFAYEQVWNPICLRGPYACRMASLVFSMTGGWVNQGFAVQLLPDAESTPAPVELAQSFGVRVNCEGDVQLETTELGQERIFTRDRCAEQSCSENEHCELVPVMCIQAPCPPQPACVPN